MTIQRTTLWLAALIAAGCSASQAPPPNREVGVAFSGSLITVAERPVAERRQAAGTVRAVRETTLASRLLAQVRTVSKQAGQPIREGEVLVELDDRQLRARRDQAAAARQEAIHALEEAGRSLEAARAGETAARERERLAQVTFERFERLLEKKSVSRQEFDEVDARRQTAAADLQRATRSAEAIEARQSGIRARIAQAESELQAAAASLDDAVIRAPLDGIVAMRRIEPGDMATPGTPLLTLEGKNYRVEAEVPESWASSLKRGQQVSIEIDALASAWTLKVTSVDPTADPRSRTVIVKVDLPSSSDVRSGLFARLSIAAESHAAILLPADCIVERGQLTGVYVADSDKSARFRLIRTGPKSGEDIEIVSGLSVGERVVAVPRESIRTGG